MASIGDKEAICAGVQSSCFNTWLEFVSALDIIPFVSREPALEQKLLEKDPDFPDMDEDTVSYPDQQSFVEPGNSDYGAQASLFVNDDGAIRRQFIHLVRGEAHPDTADSNTGPSTGDLLALRNHRILASRKEKKIPTRAIHPKHWNKLKEKTLRWRKGRKSRASRLDEKIFQHLQRRKAGPGAWRLYALEFDHRMKYHKRFEICHGLKGARDKFQGVKRIWSKRKAAKAWSNLYLQLAPPRRPMIRIANVDVTSSRPRVCPHTSRQPGM